MCRNKKRRAKYKRTLGILAGLVIALILIALICAREADRPKREDFTPVVRTIQRGDTAWRIADEYCPDTLDKRVYLGWCEQLNGSSMGYIKAGEQVVVLECVR